MASEINTSRLRLARERSGLSQVELSRAVGVTATLAGQWERGQREPSLLYLKGIAKTLNVSVGWLLGMDEAMPGGAIADGSRAVYGAETVTPDTPERVLADYGAHVGLRDLAGQPNVCHALAITGDEWSSLASLRVENGLSQAGYLGLLALLRTAVLTSDRLVLASRPGRRVGRPPKTDPDDDVKPA